MQTAAGGAGPQIAFMDFARASGAMLVVFTATRPNGRAPISNKTRSRKPLRPITPKAPTPAACTERRNTILVTLLLRCTPPLIRYYCLFIRDTTYPYLLGPSARGGTSALLSQKIDIIKLAPAANQHPGHWLLVLISGQPRLPARRPNL